VSDQKKSSWLKLIEKCTDCKACEDVCSIFQAIKKYPPYDKLRAVQQLLQSLESGKPENWEAVFLCTKCEACDECCPEDIPITHLIDLGRCFCVEKWGIQYPRQSVITENIRKHGNPFGHQEGRTAWLGELPHSSDTLVHIGCMMSYPLSSMGKSIINILKKLKIDFTISPNERCCGYFVFNSGNHKVAQEIISQNMKVFKQYKQIITLCCGCYTFIKEHYPLKIPITHVIEVIFEKVQNLKINEGYQGERIIFQDSCHIARPHGITDPPRTLIKKMGFELFEFDLPTCCGADGGMRIINPEVAQKAGKLRLLEAKEKSAHLTTLCPFCIAHFRDVADKQNIEIKITSLFKLLEASLP